jgi:hypothetical protein
VVPRPQGDGHGVRRRRVRRRRHGLQPDPDGHREPQQRRGKKKLPPESPGADVMITIFRDFCQFSAKKIGVFLKNNCYDKIFAKISCILSKNANFFAKFFGEKCFKNCNIGS